MEDPYGRDPDPLRTELIGLGCALAGVVSSLQKKLLSTDDTAALLQALVDHLKQF